MADEERQVYYQDYIYYPWSIGESITQDKMVRIEQGIDSAFQLLKDTATVSNLNTVSERVDNVLSGYSSRIAGAESNASRALNATSDGTSAWNQLYGAGVRANGTSLASILNTVYSNATGYTDGLVGNGFTETTVTAVTNNLTDRLEALESSAGGTSDDIDAIKIAIAGLKGTYESPSARLTSIENSIDLLESDVATLSGGGHGSNYETLAERLTAIDNDSIGFRTLPAVDTEIMNARGKDASNNAYLNLSQRLNASDNEVAAVRSIAESAVPNSKISHILTSTDQTQVLGADQGPAITTAIANAQAAAVQTANGYADTNKIAKTSIFNGLNQDANTTGTVLDARQGAALNSRLTTVESEITSAHITGDATTLDARFDNIDGGTKPSRTLPNLITEVEDARTSHVVQYDNDGTMTDTTYASLDARLEAIESTQSSNNTSLNGRITALETEVDMTSANSRIDIIENNVNGAKVENGPQTLDARFDAVESRATQLETDVNTIATELSMIDNNTIINTGTRVDTIEYNISHTATQEDNTTGLTQHMTAAETAIGNLQTEIGGAHRSNGDTLDTRFDDIEGDIISLSNAIDHVQGENDELPDGLNQRVTAIETNITGNGGIEDRLNALDTAETGAIAQLQAADTEFDSRLDAIDGGSALDTTKGTLATRVTNTESLLATTASKADTALQPADITTLTTDVNTLKDKDTIVVDYDGEHSNYTEDEPNSDAVPTPSANADYLIADDEGHYFYWRYINNNWELISGAGGGGTGSSSGVILSELPLVTAGDPNIDYFIGNNINGYTHYRFIAPEEGEQAGHYIQIIPNNLSNNLGVQSVSLENGTPADQWPDTTQNFSGGLEGYNINDTTHSNNIFADFVAVRNARIATTYDAQDNPTEQKLQVLDTNGKLMEYPIIGGGGGGGSTSLYTAYIESPTSITRSVPTNSTDPVTIIAKVIIQQGNTILPHATAEGTIQYRQKGSSTWNTGKQIEVVSDTADGKYTILNDTNFTMDITQYLKEDITMEFRLALSAYPASEEEVLTVYSATFKVTYVNISIQDESFNYAQVKDGNFQFNYRCFGVDINKTVHFLMDDTTTDTSTTEIATKNIGTSHNKQEYEIIDMSDKVDGMYRFQVYFTTSTGLKSNVLNYFILYNTDNTRQAPMIGVAAERTSITDGDELVVNYALYTRGSEKTDKLDIELYTLNASNEKDFSSITHLTEVENNKLASPPYKTFNYPRLVKAQATDPDPEPRTVYVQFTATHTAIINSEEVQLTDTQTVKVEVNYLHTTYDLTPARENNLLYSYVAYGHSNNDQIKDTYVYPYTTTSGNVINFTGTFDGFNWSTDGYTDGESLLIGGGATYNINVPIFSSSFNKGTVEEPNMVNFEEDGQTEITQNGRTIEIDYEVLSTTKMNDTIISCISSGQYPKGFVVTPQNCYLINSGSGIDIDETGFIKNENNVAAAYLNPGTRTHLTFVIEPWAPELGNDGKYHQSTNIYINGEFANACPYKRNSSNGALDGNDFTTDATITIGSDTCLIKLYSIKLYNRGLTEAQVLHNYAVAPVITREKLIRLQDNDVLNSQGLVDYEKARKKYTCLLLTGMGTVNGVNVPTMAPYKGYPSVVGRIKDNDIVGKTESGLLLTKPTTANSNGYVVEFNLQDRLVDPNNQYGYASSNNVQGTSSQKFPVKNLKVYLAKGDDEQQITFDESTDISVKQVYKYSINTAATAAFKSVYGDAVSLPTYIKECGKNIQNAVKALSAVPTQEEVVELIIAYLNEEDAAVGTAYSTYSTGNELITHPIKAYKKSKKVKYALRGENGLSESTLCWKANYMSTDHANTFNANIANTLYGTEDRLSDRWTDQTQYAIYGIKCLLFQQNGEGAVPEFVGDGSLNNDKGNHNTFGLETNIEGGWQDSNNNTMCQKWDFRNNTNSLLFFKHDGLFEIIDGKPAAASCLECIYPDEGDLADEQALYKEAHNGTSDPTLDVNYNHFQILASWLGNRANYWYETDASARATKKNIFINEFRNHFNFNHILIYYLFMEYTALCDNRVKNIHMRTDNAGEEKIRIKNTNTYYFEGNSNPNSGPWTIASNLETRIKHEPIMDENGDYQFDQSGNMILGDIGHVFVTDSVLDTIDWEQGENHSNFAIWAPVLYDLDSCFGAENVGYLKVRYDADWDYSLYNKLQFAGFDSILWMQVEDCFQDELKVMAKKLYDRVVGLNYSTFYRQQIQTNLESVCPALTNQDMILKYDVPWVDGFLDYSKDPPQPNTQEYKYLQRGTRAAQKSTFMKQRSMLLSSKYDGNEFKQNKITFRAGTLVNKDNAILTLIANQKLYHGVQYGDLNDISKVTRRANKMYDADTEQWIDIEPDTQIPEFVPCQVQNIGDMGNTDGIEIYGASVLNDIGDLSKFHPYQIDVGNAVNLKKLIIGSSAAGYSNTSTDAISGLNSCALLEEINVCNCKNLTSLQLSSNGFIKKVYATGSGLKTLSLPLGGVLDTIEYGENTTDITIINQSKLTNFSYENSLTNNYHNISRLWIENTPNIPIKEIITARLTPLGSQDEGLRAGGIRIIGLNLNLGSDTSFLELINSDLIKGSYLTSTGSHSTDPEAYPTITGTITINRIRASLLADLRTHYPDLIITANQTITEHTVTYYDSDKVTVLYVDHGTDQTTPPDYIKDPVYDTNPLTNRPYRSIPTKPSDKYYDYYFGTYDGNGDYERFSGWVKKDNPNEHPENNETISDNIDLVAVYPTRVDRQYTIRWFQDASDSQPKATLTVNQGTPMANQQNYPFSNGYMSYIRTSGNNTYVFKGWSRPLGIIYEDIDLYAMWDISTITASTNSITMNTLNAADLYALANLSPSKKKELLKDELGSAVMIPLGQQYDYPGIEQTNLLGNNSILKFNGTRNDAIIYNDIQPLAFNQDWTLAIDYKFYMNASDFIYNEYVLASCYQNVGNSMIGFKLSLIHSTEENNYSHTVQVSWGNQTHIIDYVTTNNQEFKSYRNMVVLSHSATAPYELKIYYVAPNNSSVLIGSDQGSEKSTYTLNYTSHTDISTPLIFGGNYQGDSTTIEMSNNNRRPAQGMIYWAKYWNTNLGDVACSDLAAWPHELVPFYLTGYNGESDRASEQIYNGSALSFAAARGIGSRRFYAVSSGTTDDQGYFGWHQSRMRTICNNLIYSSLPQQYRLIINHQLISSIVHYFGEDLIDESQKIKSLDTEDYFFLGARRELDASLSQNARERGETEFGPWAWINGSRKVYKLWSVTSDTVELKNELGQYYLYRFENTYINDDTRIFKVPTNPATINSLSIRYGEDDIRPTTIQPGDIWIDNSGNAYVFCSTDDIANGLEIDILVTRTDPVDGQIVIGGWKSAEEWALRTYNNQSPQSAQEFHFMRITNIGSIVTAPQSTTARNTPRLLCPEFTIAQRAG